MNEPPLNPTLERLAHRFFDLTLTSEERRRLESLLRDEENRRLFVEVARLEYAINCHALAASNVDIVESVDRVHRTILSSSVTPSPPVGATGEPEPGRSRGPGLSRVWLAVAVGIVVLVTALVAGSWHLRTPAPRDIRIADTPQATAPFASTPSPVSTEPDYVARIVGATKDLCWDATGVPQDVLLRLTPRDHLKVERGLLEIEFGGGATLLLEGPAELAIRDERSAMLLRGAVTGRSTNGDFSLLTPGAEVLDIGTEFGVLVSGSNRTEVAVFEGEVHLKSLRNPAAARPLKLTTGMTAMVDETGIARRATEPLPQEFRRSLGDDMPRNLGAREASLVDVISGGDEGEFRWAGAIDPRTGHWSRAPWVEALGVQRSDSQGRFVSVSWNPLVNGVFVPSAQGGSTVVDGNQDTVDLPATSGTAWGPVWARRRIDGDLDPLKQLVGHDVQGFWGTGTVSALLDRSRYAGDGLVGMHANIGLTLDLEAIRKSRRASIRSIRGVVAYLEQTRDSQPFQPDSLANFQVFVDGEPRYERLRFSRRDGDAQFGADIRDNDRFLTLVVTDGGDGPTYDRIILIDPVLELDAP